MGDFKSVYLMFTIIIPNAFQHQYYSVIQFLYHDYKFTSNGGLERNLYGHKVCTMSMLIWQGQGHDVATAWGMRNTEHAKRDNTTACVKVVKYAYSKCNKTCSLSLVKEITSYTRIHHNFRVLSHYISFS